VAKSQIDLFIVYGFVGIGGIIGWLFSMKRILRLCNRYRWAPSQKSEEFGMVIGPAMITITSTCFSIASLIPEPPDILYIMAALALGIGIAWFSHSSENIFRKQAIQVSLEVIYQKLI
jgi:hypothetical protein